MKKIIDKYTEEEILKVVKAYLVDGFSHRKIQVDILGLPAPARGDGFVAMDILHYYNIKGEKKGILIDNDIEFEIEKSSGKYKDILMKLKSYLQEYENLNSLIKGIELTSIKETEMLVETKRRIGQDVLRRYVLDIYEHKCALCNIDKDDLLVCSHIVPWNMDEGNRLNPKNTICLCVLHDKLFDKGYFSFDERYNIVYGKKADSTIVELLKDNVFSKPRENCPDKVFLEVHRNIYCK